MKVLLKLESRFYTQEQNNSLYRNMIEINWNIPCLPNKHDLVEINDIVDNMPEWDEGSLSWLIDFIQFTKIDSQIVPIIWLQGE